MAWFMASLNYTFPFTKTRLSSMKWDMCTFMADSHCCMIETNTTLKKNYPLIKNTFLKIMYYSLKAKKQNKSKI